jgi:hypothetical protein
MVAKISLNAIAGGHQQYTQAGFGDNGRNDLARGWITAVSCVAGKLRCGLNKRGTIGWAIRGGAVNCLHDGILLR